MKPHWEKFVLPLLAAAVLIAAWHYSVVLSGTRVFVTPAQVARGIGELIRRGVLIHYVADSLIRVGCGYLAAVLIGVPLGLVLGWSPLSFAALNPVIQILRPISPLAWIPVAIVWFGVGNMAPIFLIFIASLFPIVVSTVSAVRNVPPVFWNAGRNFGLPTVEVLRRVLFPASCVQILIGLRTALGIAWLVIVAAEMIAVDSGLGYLIIDSRNAGKRYDLVIAGMILIGMIGIVLDGGIRSFERLKSLRWGFLSEH